MKRRNFLRNFGGTAFGLSILQTALAKGMTENLDLLDDPYQVLGNSGAVGNIVVVGGGMAGTTMAKFLRLWGGTGVKVTLVEPNATYYSNIFSNMVLTGERTLSQLAYNYSTLQSKYGVIVKNYAVTYIDPTAKSVTLSSGEKLMYSRLVLAPGIDFEQLPITGTKTNIDKVVHAWKAGVQTTSLKNQIQSMTRKDTFIITIPPKPYRCPPGPYERACVVADYLKRTKGGGKVIILDANSGLQAEPENFTKAFTQTHKGIITYVPNAVISSISADTGTIITASAGTFKGKVLNVIPTHKAGNLITQSGIGLNNAGGGKWAGVNVLTYESTVIPFVHVIGDSSSTTQPKAGHIANAEAKVCAAAIIQLLKGEPINPTPVTNSSCFTPITKTTASWLSVVFKYDATTGTMVPTGSGVTESAGATSENYEDMLKWFNNLMSDTFK
ncbi:MAG: FAD-dependent oxidoreductase [Chitinophagaceae bacterium]|nr:FAD-dependent oxidoreductase [Chitinophagaceae bacterium]